MNRRQTVAILLAAFARPTAAAARPSVSTPIGTGSRGYSDHEVNNPYGLVIGPDRALYVCDLDNQRIRRLDLETHRTSVVAGNGQRAYGGDGKPAPEAALNMPHEVQFDSTGNMYVAERDNHVIRKVDAKTGIISTFAGTGLPGFSGDGGQAAHAQLRQPHSIVVDSDGNLLICDIGNHRIRRVDLHRRDRDLCRHRRASTNPRRRAGEKRAVERPPNHGP
jgi:streptogramin lyase